MRPKLFSLVRSTGITQDDIADSIVKHIESLRQDYRTQREFRSLVSRVPKPGAIEMGTQYIARELLGSFLKDQKIQIVAQNVDKTAKQTGVTQQAVHFKELAGKYSILAAIWLFVAIVAGIGLYLYVRNFQLPDVKDPLLMAEHLIPRLVTVTLLSTGLIFCIRNFSALMHNVIVNRLRHTALTTFQTFVTSTTDEGTKNAVLLQSTQAIFAPQPSGYLKTESEVPQTNQVTEIVRSMAGKEKD